MIQTQTARIFGKILESAATQRACCLRRAVISLADAHMASDLKRHAPLPFHRWQPVQQKDFLAPMSRL